MYNIKVQQAPAEFEDEQEANDYEDDEACTELIYASHTFHTTENDKKKKKKTGPDPIGTSNCSSTPKRSKTSPPVQKTNRPSRIPLPPSSSSKSMLLFRSMPPH